MNEVKIARAKRIKASKAHKSKRSRSWDHLSAIAAKKRDERKGKI
jgi:hypothetical protein